MSILFSQANSNLISHEAFVSRVYLNTQLNDGTERNFHLLPEIFDLNAPYRAQKTDNRQRKIQNKTNCRDISENRQEYELIQRIASETKRFIGCCRDTAILNVGPGETLDNSRLKLWLVKWKSVESVSVDKFSGGNTLCQPLVTRIDGHKYLIPANSLFFNCDVNEIATISLSASFDLIVVDPPWWNKYVRRTKQADPSNGYRMLSNDAIENIPIGDFVDPHKTVVAVWCTNAPSAISAVLQRFFYRWQLKLISTWYWIKISKTGDPICEFGLPLKKQPFERLYIGCHQNCDAYNDRPTERFIFSVPSGIHSHKPPLQELMADFMESPLDSITSLDIFARYLMPHCTSVGLEVLKLQNAELFASDPQ